MEELTSGEYDGFAKHFIPVTQKHKVAKSI